MTRYQIVYNKSGYPLTTWSNNPDQAHELAEKFRNVGYSVDVWEHTDKGTHKTSLPGRVTPVKAAPPHLPDIYAGNITKQKGGVFMVRCWIYSAGPDQCQCYNVDDENLADLAAQAQFLEDFRAQRAASPALYRQLLNMLVPAADAIPMRNYTGLPF